jgi:hypothetical protein
MIGILIAVIFAAIVYIVCTALGLPYAVALIAALLTLLVGFLERDRFPR